MAICENFWVEIYEQRAKYLINVDEYLLAYLDGHDLGYHDRGHDSYLDIFKKTTNDMVSDFIYVNTKSNSDTDDKYAIVNEALVPMILGKKSSCSDDTREKMNVE